MLFLQAYAISSFGVLALVANYPARWSRVIIGVWGHNWGQGAMKLRSKVGSAVLASILLMVASAAQAGDAAARRIIGFSPDGTYFAFEQYGTLDAGASNSGWSEIEIIDTRTDEFVGGQPIRIVDETQEASLTLDQARAQAGRADGVDPLPICHSGARRADGLGQVHLSGRHGRLPRRCAPRAGLAEMAFADL